MKDRIKHLPEPPEPHPHFHWLQSTPQRGSRENGDGHIEVTTRARHLRRRAKPRRFSLSKLPAARLRSSVVSHHLILSAPTFANTVWRRPLGIVSIFGPTGPDSNDHVGSSEGTARGLCALLRRPTQRLIVKATSIADSVGLVASAGCSLLSTNLLSLLRETPAMRRATTFNLQV